MAKYGKWRNELQNRVTRVPRRREALKVKYVSKLLSEKCVTWKRG
jgi:hypothetical protein